MKNMPVSLEEAKQVLRRVFVIYDFFTGKAYLNDDREEAQQCADAGQLVLEYGLISRLRGVNDVMVPVSKED